MHRGVWVLSVMAARMVWAMTAYSQPVPSRSQRRAARRRDELRAGAFAAAFPAPDPLTRLDPLTGAPVDPDAVLRPASKPVASVVFAGIASVVGAASMVTLVASPSSRSVATAAVAGASAVFAVFVGLRLTSRARMIVGVLAVVSALLTLTAVLTTPVYQGRAVPLWSSAHDSAVFVYTARDDMVRMQSFDEYLLAPASQAYAASDDAKINEQWALSRAEFYKSVIDASQVPDARLLPLARQMYASSAAAAAALSAKQVAVASDADSAPERVQAARDEFASSVISASEILGQAASDTGVPL